MDSNQQIVRANISWSLPSSNCQKHENGLTTTLRNCLQITFHNLVPSLLWKGMTISNMVTNHFSAVNLELMLTSYNLCIWQQQTKPPIKPRNGINCLSTKTATTSTTPHLWHRQIPCTVHIQTQSKMHPTRGSQTALNFTKVCIHISHHRTRNLQSNHQGYDQQCNHAHQHQNQKSLQWIN